MRLRPQVDAQGKSQRGRNDGAPHADQRRFGAGDTRVQAFPPGDHGADDVFAVTR